TENLQDVPISVTAITAEALSASRAKSLSDLQGSVPNVQLMGFANQPNAAAIVIRGIGVSDADPYVGTDVSVVIDGVVQATNQTSNLYDLFDVDRIEILRGPQGTLFGANTAGGVVNVITKQPTGVYGGEFKATVGSFGTEDLAAAINFPIADNLAGKV